MHAVVPEVAAATAPAGAAGDDGEDGDDGFVPWLYRATRLAVGTASLEPAPLRAGAARLRGMERGIVAQLASVRPELVPGEDARQALDVRRRVAIDGLRILSGIRGIVEKLERAGIPWACLKGLHHVAALYPGPEWRPMTDVDLLVPPRHADDVSRLLAEEGYGGPLPSSWMGYALTFQGSGPTLDLHLALARRGTYHPDVEAMLRRTHLLAAGGVRVRVFSHPADAYVAHALLLAKDGFAPRDTTALRIVELALLHDRLDAGDERGMRSLDESMAAAGARRVQERCGALVAWARGGRRPAWLRGISGGADPASKSASARWRFYADTALLLDGPRERARYLLLEGAVALARLASARRWPRLA